LGVALPFFFFFFFFSVALTADILCSLCVV
jgi:hypothetical protein